MTTWLIVAVRVGVEVRVSTRSWAGVAVDSGVVVGSGRGEGVAVLVLSLAVAPASSISAPWIGVQKTDREAKIANPKARMTSVANNAGLLGAGFFR
jgi:hypothetical protein